MSKSRIININGEPYIETETEDGFIYERLYNIEMTIEQHNHIIAMERAAEMKSMINE